MADRTVYYANKLSDVLYQMQTVSGLRVVGGCTAGPPPDRFLPALRIPELTEIERHERYIDIGAAVTLDRLVSLGKTNIPEILYEAAVSVGTSAVRNIATIGGNVCSSGTCAGTLTAPLLALEARLELRRGTETRLIEFPQFKSVPEGWILTRIRVPREEWALSLFKRTGPRARLSEESASFAFLVAVQKDVVTSMRIAFSGPVSVRCRLIENALYSTRLPLSREQVAGLMQQQRRQLDAELSSAGVLPAVRQQLLNLAGFSLQQLM